MNHAKPTFNKMSSGPGYLQRAILERLERLEGKKPQHIFQNTLLWELAVSRNELNKTNENGGIIEQGEIRRSFSESFRRAIKGLEGSGKVLVRKEKITDIFEMLDFLPYLTNRLEIHELRRRLLPTIKDFIRDQGPSKDIIDNEKYHITKLKVNNLKEYKQLEQRWIHIERGLVNLLNTADSESSLFDLWLKILLRGRYLFRDGAVPYNVRLSRLIIKKSNELGRQELHTLELLEKFIKDASANIEWKVGEVKNILYAFFNAKKYGAASLSEELKTYLFERHEDILKSLPGHEEPEKDLGWVHLPSRRRYSLLLDQLFSRHILRKQIIIRANY